MQTPRKISSSNISIITEFGWQHFQTNFTHWMGTNTYSPTNTTSIFFNTQLSNFTDELTNKLCWNIKQQWKNKLLYAWVSSQKQIFRGVFCFKIMCIFHQRTMARKSITTISGICRCLIYWRINSATYVKNPNNCLNTTDKRQVFKDRSSMFF